MSQWDSDNIRTLIVPVSSFSKEGGRL